MSENVVRIFYAFGQLSAIVTFSVSFYCRTVFMNLRNVFCTPTFEFAVVASLLHNRSLSSFSKIGSFQTLRDPRMTGEEPE